MNRFEDKTYAFFDYLVKSHPPLRWVFVLDEYKKFENASKKIDKQVFYNHKFDETFDEATTDEKIFKYVCDTIYGYQHSDPFYVFGLYVIPVLFDGEIERHVYLNYARGSAGE